MSSALYYLTVFLVDPCFVDENLKMIPRESNKGYKAKTGRCVHESTEQEKDRYTTFPYP